MKSLDEIDAADSAPDTLESVKERLKVAHEDHLRELLCLYDLHAADYHDHVRHLYVLGVDEPSSDLDNFYPHRGQGEPEASARGHASFLSFCFSRLFQRDRCADPSKEIQGHAAGSGLHQSM